MPDAICVHGPVTDADCVAFLQWALPKMRMRWPGFRRPRRQVRKRLSRRLRALGIESFDGYRLHLETHPGEWDVLDGLCRITISSFYRDRAVFDAFRDPILPACGRAALDRGDREIRVWSAGCASGEEPYSFVLAWELDASRQVPSVKLETIASDVDLRMLDRARRACYPRGSLKELPARWIDRAFDMVDETWCLRPTFRGRVELVQQDVREQMPSGPFDLVLCRNLVFTYFELSLQAALLERILARLRPGGLLIVGGHEALPHGTWPLARPWRGLPIHRMRESAATMR